MIDLYNIEIAFISIGPKEWSRLPGHTSTMSRIPRAHIRLKHPNWMAEQKALIIGDHFRLQVCPAKVLGRWNAYGTNDLRKAVAETAPLVLRAMGIEVTAEIRERLGAGDYVVRAVDITEQFHLPNHGITDFLTHLRQRMIGSHDVRRSRGQGFYVNSGNRRCEYIVYNKLVEMHSRATQRYAQRLGASVSTSGIGMREVGLMIDRGLQLHLAALGPRLEVRLGDQFFRHHRLAAGDAWTPATAESVFRDEVDRLRLPSSVDATWARRTARQRLALQELRTYLLWAQGEPLAVAAGSPKTIDRRAKAIERVLGLDIHQPASSVLGNRGSVDPTKVFAWKNRVKAREVDLDRDLGSLNEHVSAFA
jgi:hypothetical protein